MDTAPSIGRRYQVVSTLGAGSMGTVFRVKDRLGGQVALKQMTAARREIAQPQRPPSHLGSTVVAPASGSGPLLLDGFAAVDRSTETFLREATSHSAETLVAPDSRDASQQAEITRRWRLVLAREFRLLSSLRHPNIISVLDYGFDDRLEPYFTMELLEGGQSILDAGQGRPLEVQLDLLQQMLQALAYLHRRGAIHRDLKPGNVMVVDGRVKVLDFGIAILRDQGSKAPRAVAGTLAYMAPEILSLGAPSAASDLYAVGVMAYELLAGSYPFTLVDASHLIFEIMTRVPDLSAIDARLQPVVGRLLAKDPAERHADVAEVLEALTAATGRRLGAETHATRESFLQAAKLVGREAELLELDEALTQALSRRGGGVLLGGESGVGKSRLLDELRARALVSGAAVLRGQEVSDGARPYQGWREVLRSLALLTDPSDEEAGVLKPLISDLAAILEREVPDAPELDPEAVQTRLLATVEGVLRRQDKPMVLLLEDIHWAGSESLKLLGRLLRAAPEMPLLLVASFRDDERPELPRELSAMRLVKVGRLPPDGISALSESMLGAGGRKKEVVDLLLRETEGNPFFLVEIVRALAEEAGDLERIGSAPLPAAGFAGGLARVVQRRLDRVPAWARPLVQSAAILGRRLDPRLLGQIDPGRDLEEWLSACAAAAVIDVSEGSWRFAHDKLREGVLSGLSAEERRALHRTAAEAIEAVYPEAPAQFGSLARHWSGAAVAEKSIAYLEKAGELALRDFSNREAIGYFTEALATDEQASRPSPPLRRGRWERALAEAHLGLGERALAMDHAKKALRHLGSPMPEDTARWVLGLLGEIPVRVAQSYFPSRFEERSKERRATLLEASQMYNRLVEVFFLANQPLEGTYCGLRNLNLAERVPPSPPLARGYAFMSIIVGLSPLDRVARSWSERALDIADRVGSEPALVYAYGRVACYSITTARWEEAHEQSQRAVERARRAGDRRQLEESLTIYMHQLYWRGRVAETLPPARELLDSAAARGDDQTLSWGRNQTIQALTRLGRPAEGVALVNDMLAWITPKAGDGEKMYAYGNAASAYLYAGDLARARESADLAVACMRRTRPVGYFSLNGLVGVAEVYLRLWEDGAREKVVAEHARFAVSSIDAFAAMMRFGRPSALLCKGSLSWLEGKRAPAFKLWSKAGAEAERMAMPYEQGWAHLLMGRHLAASERRRHLETAAGLFAAVGAAGAVKQAREALDATSRA